MLTPGTVLNNRYRIESYLERSEVGEVYLAADLDRQAPVTLKVLREELAENPSFVREFQREAPALAALDHPNIARFYALEQEGALAYTVAEYVPGTTLRRRLADVMGPLPAGEAAKIAEQVGDALAYAHGQGVVHGDLQTGNIVLNNGQAIVEDFGFATAMQQAGDSAALLGNSAYTSPEQLQGQDPTARSDVYGLGALLYEMVTGRQPFANEPGGQLANVQARPLPINPGELNRGLAPGAAAVIMQALSGTPGSRQPDTDALAHAWLQALPRRAPASVGRGAAVAVPTPVARGAAVARPGFARQPGVPVGPAAVSAPRSTVGSTGAVPTGPWRSRWALGGILLAAGLLLVVVVAWLALSRLSSQNRTAAWAAGNFGPTETPTAGLVAQLLNATPNNNSSAKPGTTGAVGGRVGTPTSAARAATATPANQAVPYVLVRVAANLRDGPGTNYTSVGGASPGTQLPIVGRNAAGDWWQVCCVSNGPAWIFADLVSTGGPLGNVPLVQGPVLPSPTLTATPVSPTATPVPPTATAIPPAPTSGPTDTPQPNPTEVPTAEPPATTGGQAACTTQPAGAFTRLSDSVIAVTGCPVNPLIETHFSHQFFEHGQMVYRYDLRSIYVLYNDGTWASYPDTYVEGQPLQLQDMQAPDGLKQPIKGFDRVWERPEVRSRLGWATRDEMGVVPGEAQAFQKGTALWLNSPSYLVKYLVLLSNGRWGQS